MCFVDSENYLVACLYTRPILSLIRALLQSYNVIMTSVSNRNGGKILIHHKRVLCVAFYLSLLALGSDQEVGCNFWCI